MSQSVSKEPANGPKPLQTCRKIRPSDGESTLSALIPVAANSILSKKKGTRRLADGPLPFTPFKPVESVVTSSVLTDDGRNFAMKPSTYTGLSRFNATYAALDRNKLNFLERNSAVFNAVKEADKSVTKSDQKVVNVGVGVGEPVRKIDAPLRSFNEINTSKSSVSTNVSTNSHQRCTVAVKEIEKIGKIGNSIEPVKKIDAVVRSYNERKENSDEQIKKIDALKNHTKDKNEHTIEPVKKIDAVVRSYNERKENSDEQIKKIDGLKSHAREKNENTVEPVKKIDVAIKNYNERNEVSVEPVRKIDTPLRSYNERNKNSASTNYGVPLTAKRDLFFRDSANSVTSNGTTNGTTTANTTTPSLLTSKEQTSIYGKENKDLDGEPTPRYKEREKEHHPNNIKDLDGYVGFANLPNQVYRKAVKKGFEFTLMVVGESGLGKSTLINSMFLSDVYSAEHPGPSHRIKKTVQVETTKVLLKESGVNLTLTVVDTPGFGDAVDNSNCWQPVMDYIETKYEEYLNSESRVNRRTTPDNRVHCCLYFLSPSGHGLKPLDVEFMKRLHDKVNIIPLVAKADTMTPEECVSFKQKIINEISQHKIKIYEFPDGDDEEETKVQKPLKDRVPFAVVGSNTIIDINGKKVRGRKYPWGVAEVENMEHCDFIALRNMLIRTHMQDLKDITNNVHYENFRCRKLAGIGSDGKPLRVSSKNPLAQMEEEKKEREQKIKKTEQEMEQVFEMKVREKKQKLKDSEADLQRRHEQMKKSLEQQESELNEKRKAFEKEKNTWEELNKASLEDMRRRSLESNSKEHSRYSSLLRRRESIPRIKDSRGATLQNCPQM